MVGDLGDSIRTNSPIHEEIWIYLAATFELAFCAMLIAILVGVNAGIINAWFQRAWFDYLAMLLALIGVSMPIFWLGLLEQWLFAVNLGRSSYYSYGDYCSHYSLQYAGSYALRLYPHSTG